MISLHKVNYSQNKNKILQDINLNIWPGEVTVLCGESGSGKSSVLNIISGLIPNLYGGNVTGEIRAHHEPLSFDDYASEIGMVFQNSKSQFINPDVYSELAFAMENVGMDQKTMIQRIDNVVNYYHAQDLLNRAMFDLSGGQRQMTALMSATMLKPPLYLLDEPSSNLDVTAIEQLRRQILDLKNEGSSVIIADHRLYYLIDLADQFVVIDNGHIKCQISRQEMRENATLLATKYRLRNLTAPRLRLTKTRNMRNLSDLITLEAHNLKFKYHRHESLIDIKSLELSNRDVIGISGENGAGKSTLIQLLTGMIKHHEGTILFNGQQLSRKQLVKNSFLVMQDVHLQLFFETVEKEISNGSRLTEQDRQLLESLKLTKLLKRHPQTLSGGEKQRVAIATALLSGKKIIVMDEPTSGMDYDNMQRLSSLIAHLKRAGILLIIVSHDQEFLNMTCSKVLIMNHGRITTVVTPDSMNGGIHND